jgi:hypothetical protein
VADVKFYVGGLTACQAIDFMSRVKLAVDRDPRQTLSSQFNVNVVILDDRPSNSSAKGRSQRVKEPAAIAQLGTELTSAAGWDRVTLDSASQTMQTTPLVEVLQAGALSEWVHRRTRAA